MENCSSATVCSIYFDPEVYVVAMNGDTPDVSLGAWNFMNVSRLLTFFDSDRYLPALFVWVHE